MPTDYVQKAIELARPLHPVEQPLLRDWERVEHELGLQLPMDYKALVTALGSGEFGVGLTINTPVSSSEHTRLSADELRGYRQTVLFLEERMGIALFSASAGPIVDWWH